MTQPFGLFLLCLLVAFAVIAKKDYDDQKRAERAMLDYIANEYRHHPHGDAYGYQLGTSLSTGMHNTAIMNADKEILPWHPHSNR